jgi:hypothetical protein
VATGSPPVWRAGTKTNVAALQGKFLLKGFNVTQGRIKTENTLIASLPAQEAARFAPLLERVALKQRDVHRQEPRETPRLLWSIS